MDYTARMTYDDQIIVQHDGEDTDFVLLPDGALIGAVIDCPASQEWEPEKYDQALRDAGWKRTGEWSSNDASATAPVEPA